jgi:hypothetical protein
MRLLLSALAASLLGLGPAEACTHPPGTVEYVVKHETYGEVGHQVIAFSCAGDDLVVETRIEGEVTLLTVPIFERDAHYHEVWRGDRLLAFDSHYVDNGEVYEVKARADGEHTIIEGRRGRIEAPATVVSNDLWNFAVLDRPLLFDTQRGRLQHVQVTPAGEETITTAGGQKISARKYVMSGDLDRELWYDEDGNWLQSHLEYKGNKFTVTRK